MSEDQNKEIISKDKLLEAGVYFGHNKSKWNPKMKPYILTVKKGTHILDIQKTKKTLEFAYSIVKKFAERGASFIFVGTRKQAKEAVRNNALRTNSYYVSERWLGGTLTNSRTIFSRVRRMFELERMQENNFDGYTKKEGVLFSKELAKLQKNLSGIKNMRNKPNVMIAADPKTDEIAIAEAKKLGIKVIGIIDTNVDPSLVDIAIPANDDSIKSVTLILTVLADAIAAAKDGQQLYAYQPDSEIVLPEDLKPEFKPKRPGFRRFNNDSRNPRDFKSRPSRARENTSSTSAASKPKTVSPKIEAPKVEAPKVEAPKVEAPKVEAPKVEVEAPKKVEQVNNQDLSEMKVADLREMAKNKEIKGFSTMKKAELLEALS